MTIDRLNELKKTIEYCYRNEFSLSLPACNGIYELIDAELARQTTPICPTGITTCADCENLGKCPTAPEVHRSPPQGDYDGAIQEMKEELDIIMPAYEQIKTSNLSRSVKQHLIKSKYAYDLAISCLQYCKERSKP